MTGHMAESSQSAISLSLVDIDSLPSCLDFLQKKGFKILTLEALKLDLVNF